MALYVIHVVKNRKCGWSSLAVTQPSTSHHLLCVLCVCVCKCVTALSGIYHSGPSRQHYRLQLVNSAISHRAFSTCARDPQFNYPGSSHPLLATRCCSFTDLQRKDGSPSVGCPTRGSWTSDLLHGRSYTNEYARTLREAWRLTNWATSRLSNHWMW